MLFVLTTLRQVPTVSIMFSRVQGENAQPNDVHGRPEPVPPDRPWASAKGGYVAQAETVTSFPTVDEFDAAVAKLAEATADLTELRERVDTYERTLEAGRGVWIDDEAVGRIFLLGDEVKRLGAAVTDTGERFVAALPALAAES
jgi:hypothetical protein